ncbi:MAG: ABC transporter substrate-binding protein [Deltaproteobacteria bacterium]|nr:ABC transporter substrate-binding protein [Deltaproteobacteria bacterium]MBW2070160.1 ABC transporter substrate-binding protein [Deltaproteobacteria bacterium]
MKRVMTVLLVMAMVCVLGAPAMSAEPIRIGVYLPMTGAVAAYGQMEWDGIKAAHDMMPKVLGREVKLFLVDTKSDKIEAANAVDRLIKKEKVVGIIGEAISGNTLAGGPIAEKNQIPMISPTATNPLVTQGKKYVFRACFIDPFQGEVAAKLAMNTLHAKTAAVIIDIAQDYCVGLANFFVKAFVKMGGKILTTTYIQTGDQDFSAQLSAVQATNPDIIYAPNYYTEDALMAKQARDLGINVPILTGDGAQADEIIQIGGKAVEDTYFTAHFNVEAVTTKLGRDFVAYYQKKYNKEADAFGALGADAYFILLDAIKRAGTTDGPKVRATLASTKNFQGVSGNINIGEDGNAVKSVVINKVKNGKFTYVTTINP